MNACLGSRLWSVFMLARSVLVADSIIRAVYKSTNAGRTWSRSSQGINNPG